MSFRHLHVLGSELPLAEVATPCVKICIIDDDGLCVGCARTLDESAGWGTLSDERRRAVMMALPSRREQNLKLD